MEPQPRGCGKLQSPPCKVLSGQLRHSASRQVRASGQEAWLLEREGSGRAPLDVSVVWMQGRVLDSRAQDNTTVQLRDETGTFTVTGAGAVPRGRPCISKGNYVMVMGILVSCSPEPLLRAVKVTDLSDDALHKSTWRLEVEDLQQNIP
ncbi:recQ-mediated genome instability protein 2 [Callorhinchus milii]|uniref:RecQ-mediated genome instability protein 2 n=1 Tax=Callorhinchus milii TaxID=7868 RepID=V9KIU7_CALMI|nr:recQ-mediated genome instability protein 2 [Callorhinchus milii]|eukprot:gi/632973270/ref/XP_007903072.1/ PREDICTED: recQ-mediated genome instability protein 2 [Callorhinchus milii]